MMNSWTPSQLLLAKDLKLDVRLSVDERAKFVKEFASNCRARSLFRPKFDVGDLHIRTLNRPWRPSDEQLREWWGASELEHGDLTRRMRSMLRCCMVLELHLQKVTDLDDLVSRSVERKLNYAVEHMNRHRTGMRRAVEEFRDRVKEDFAQRNDICMLCLEGQCECPGFCIFCLKPIGCRACLVRYQKETEAVKLRCLNCGTKWADFTNLWFCL